MVECNFCGRETLSPCKDRQEMKAASSHSAHCKEAFDQFNSGDGSTRRMLNKAPDRAELTAALKVGASLTDGQHAGHIRDLCADLNQAIMQATEHGLRVELDVLRVQSVGYELGTQVRPTVYRSL